MKKNIFIVFILFCLSFFMFAADNSNISVNESTQLAMSNPDYMVTAGDVYSLNFAAGSTPVSYSVMVDSTYKIRVANLGVLDVKNKSYLTVKKEVEDIVTKNYPMSGVQFVLMYPAYYNVTVVGEVNYTKDIKVWALTRLSDIVPNAGLTSYASQRNVTIESRDGKTKTVDLFNANRYGEYSENPYLRPGDIVRFNRIETKVSISGQVERPGTYELLKGEGLLDLINSYGNGLTASADLSRIEVTSGGRTVYLNVASLDDNLVKDFKLSSFDSVNIGSISTILPVVYVEGAVNSGNGVNAEVSNKITYRFNPGKNYTLFLRENAGIFSASSDLENAYLTRGDEYIPIDISKVLYDESYFVDLELQENDVLTVPFKYLFVTVLGAVNLPGRYPYVPDKDYNYYITLAGGFNTEINSGDAVTIVDKNGVKQKKSAEINPEYVITAKRNSFYYHFNKYAPMITTVLAIVASLLAFF